MGKKRSENFIKAWREFRGFKTQGDLAKASGITRASISRLESGAMPYRQSSLEKLALALDCTAADLLANDPGEKGSIFQIYARIPAARRAQALAVLETFCKKD